MLRGIGTANGRRNGFCSVLRAACAWDRSGWVKAMGEKLGETLEKPVEGRRRWLRTGTTEGLNRAVVGEFETDGQKLGLGWSG